MNTNDSNHVVGTLIRHLTERQRIQCEINSVHFDQSVADATNLIYLQAMIARWMEKDPKFAGDVLMRTLYVSEEVERSKTDKPA